MNIIDIPSDVQGTVEQLGTKEKFWFLDDRNRFVLFKCGRPNTGEHWAEVVIAGISRKLDVPHAEYTLARFGDELGVVTYDIVQQNRARRMILGNELLSRAIYQYPEAVRNPGEMYTLENVYRGIKACS